MRPNSKAPASAGTPGSPTEGEPVYLAVGAFRRAHGVRGDLLLAVLTDFPERLKPGTLLFVGNKKQPLRITRRRPHNDGIILGFEGIPNAEAAAKYHGQTVYVKAEDRPPLPQGEYYHHQIIGLNVVDESGANLGSVTEIIETGANDVYVITSADGREILLPALKEVLLDVSLETKTMRVHLLPGLVDGGENADKES